MATEPFVSAASSRKRIPICPMRIISFFIVIVLYCPVGRHARGHAGLLQIDDYQRQALTKPIVRSPKCEMRILKFSQFDNRNSSFSIFTALTSGKLFTRCIESVSQSPQIRRLRAWDRFRKYAPAVVELRVMPTEYILRLRVDKPLPGVERTCLADY
jgi:hypothetical protein